MENRAIVVPVKMDAPTFREFAVFDTLRRQRRWVSPAVFAAILMTAAIICYAQQPRSGALLLGVVLTVVALGVPIVYFAMFFHSVRVQAKRMGLDTPRDVYRVTLSDAADGVAVCAAGDYDKPEKEARVKWADVYGVWRTDSALYLFVTASRAYLMPAGQIPGGVDAAWALCEKLLDGAKCHSLTK